MSNSPPKLPEWAKIWFAFATFLVSLLIPAAAFYFGLYQHFDEEIDQLEQRVEVLADKLHKHEH